MGKGSSGVVRVSVLLRQEDAARLAVYCEEKAHKKSTLIARLVREYLDKKGVEAGGEGQP
jgi:hypothetical protein